jgi:peptidoglycan/LPS O-acetylase OafA/YrhL
MSYPHLLLPDVDVAGSSVHSPTANASPRDSPGEIRPLTGLRGIAALYVVSYHHRLGVPFSNPLTTSLAHGYLAADLFFVLSGFVMALTYSHMFARGWSMAAYVRFLGRRAARIYPLYFVATLAAFVFILAGALEAPRLAPLGTALTLNLLLIQAWGFVGSLDGPAW